VYTQVQKTLAPECTLLLLMDKLQNNPKNIKFLVRK